MLDARSPVSFADGVLDPGVTQELVDWLQHLQYRYYRITNKNEPEPFPIWHRELLGRDWPINQASDYSCTPQFLQEQTGVPYVLLDGRLNDSPAQLRQAGHILGQAERGQQLALRAQAILDSAHQAARPRAKGLKAYLARGNDGLETGMGQSIHTEVLRLCGLTVMGDEKTDNRLGRISYEQLLAWDPDILFAQDDAFFELARTQAPWSQLKAVREGRLYPRARHPLSS